MYSFLTNKWQYLPSLNKIRYNATIFVHNDIDLYVFFGLQGMVQWLLIDLWNQEFFMQPKEKVVAKYQRRMDRALGVGAVNVDHIAALHDLGYLPIMIKAVPEGSRVNIRVPVMTISRIFSRRLSPMPGRCLSASELSRTSSSRRCGRSWIVRAALR